jgi:hypothetical protein
MGFELGLDKDETIKVIVRNDSSIKSTTDEVYAEYLKDLDESRLSIEGEPTRFVLKKHLSYGDTQHVMDSQISVGEDGKPALKPSFLLEEVRRSWVGMEGPGSEVFQLQNGRAPRELVNKLYQKQALMDLYNARHNVVEGNGADVPKN